MLQNCDGDNKTILTHENHCLDTQNQYQPGTCLWANNWNLKIMNSNWVTRWLFSRNGQFWSKSQTGWQAYSTFFGRPTAFCRCFFYGSITGIWSKNLHHATPGNGRANDLPGSDRAWRNRYVLWSDICLKQELFQIPSDQGGLPLHQIVDSLVFNRLEA